jgi:hypothetical protein
MSYRLSPVLTHNFPPPPHSRHSSPHASWRIFVPLIPLNDSGTHTTRTGGRVPFHRDAGGCLERSDLQLPFYNLRSPFCIYPILIPCLRLKHFGGFQRNPPKESFGPSGRATTHSSRGIFDTLCILPEFKLSHGINSTTYVLIHPS